MDPAELQALLSRANAAHEAGDASAARDALQTILESEPGSVPARALFSRLFPAEARALPPQDPTSGRPWGFGESAAPDPEPAADWSGAIDAAWGDSGPATRIDFSAAQPGPPTPAREGVSGETLVEFSAAPAISDPVSAPAELPEPVMPPPEDPAEALLEVPPSPPGVEALDPWGEAPPPGTLIDFEGANPLWKAPPPPARIPPVPASSDPPSWHGDPWTAPEAQDEADPSRPESPAAVPADDSGAEPAPAPALEMLSGASEAERVEGSASHVLSEEDIRHLIDGTEELVARADFSGALELVTRVLSQEPEHPQALELKARCEATLVQMWESKLGPLDRCPRVLIDAEEVVWLNLDHRAGFVLAQIDSTVTYEDLFALSGMSRIDTCRILVQLLEQRVILSG